MAGPDEDAAAPPADDAGEAGFDPAARELCPDGSCTGVIGDDGRCKVCGLAGTGGSSHVTTSSLDDGEKDAADNEPSDESKDERGGEIDAPETASAADEGAADLDDRQLCPDGNCVGVIGPQGVCKVCGLPASATP